MGASTMLMLKVGLYDDGCRIHLDFAVLTRIRLVEYPKLSCRPYVGIFECVWCCRRIGVEDGKRWGEQQPHEAGADASQRARLYAWHGNIDPVPETEILARCDRDTKTSLGTVLL